MALIRCSECGKDISDVADICPNCGCPINLKVNEIGERKKGKKKVFIVVLIILISSVLVSFIYLQKRRKTPLQKAVQGAYEDLCSNLLDPDSIIIYNCYCLDYSKDEEYYPLEDLKLEGYKKDIMVYFYYGAKNRMGGISESEYVYACDENGKILIGYSDEDLEEWVEAVKSDNLSDIDRSKEVKLVTSYWVDVKLAHVGGWSDKYIEFSQEEIEKM